METHAYLCKHVCVHKHISHGANWPWYFHEREIVTEHSIVILPMTTARHQLKPQIYLCPLRKTDVSNCTFENALHRLAGYKVLQRKICTEASFGAAVLNNFHPLLICSIPLNAHDAPVQETAFHLKSLISSFRTGEKPKGYFLPYSSHRLTNLS